MHADTLRCMATTQRIALHPVRIARIHSPRFVPRVGLGFKERRTLSALIISKGWVRKNNLGLRTGCTPSCRAAQSTVGRRG